MVHKRYLQFLCALCLLLVPGIQWGLAEDLPNQKDADTYCAVINNISIFGGEICATDGKTYANYQFLNCMNFKMNTDFAIAHVGKCFLGEEHCKQDLYYSPVCGSNNEKWPNLEAAKCNNRITGQGEFTKSSDECLKTDICSEEVIAQYGSNPVCASDGFTYENAARVKCLQKNQPDLTISHDHNCRVDEVHSVFTNTPDICEAAKHRAGEFSPVCASDGNTYRHPLIFLCEKPELGVQTNSPCNSPSHRACLLKQNNKNLTEADHVCANDGRTYKTIHHLVCSSLSNKYLYWVHDGPCELAEDNPCGAVTIDADSMPVCSYDGSTFISIEALFCARRLSNNKNIKFRHDGPC